MDALGELRGLHSAAAGIARFDDLNSLQCHGDLISWDLPRCERNDTVDSLSQLESRLDKRQLSHWNIVLTNIIAR